MTSVKQVLTRRPLAGRWIVCALAAAAIALCGGCARDHLRAPSELASPFRTDQLWAVAPFNNESGFSGVDQARMSDLFTHELEQVHGVQTVPVNRVLAAMRAINIAAVTSEAEAIALLNVLGVDGIIVGSITAYDAYAPLQLGMAVQLISRDAVKTRRGLNPRDAVRSPTAADERNADAPLRIAQASGLFDASNHRVRHRLEHYASGRAVPDSAFGARIYNVSMELYTRFVSHELLRQLFASEQVAYAAAAESQ